MLLLCTFYLSSYINWGSLISKGNQIIFEFVFYRFLRSFAQRTKNRRLPTEQVKYKLIKGEFKGELNTAIVLTCNEQQWRWRAQWIIIYLTNTARSLFLTCSDLCLHFQSVCSKPVSVSLFYLYEPLSILPLSLCSNLSIYSYLYLCNVYAFRNLRLYYLFLSLCSNLCLYYLSLSVFTTYLYLCSNMCLYYLSLCK